MILCFPDDKGNIVWRTNNHACVFAKIQFKFWFEFFYNTVKHFKLVAVLQYICHTIILCPCPSNINAKMHKAVSRSSVICSLPVDGIEYDEIS